MYHLQRRAKVRFSVGSINRIFVKETSEKCIFSHNMHFLFNFSHPDFLKGGYY